VTTYDDIAKALAPCGLIPRSGFHPAAQDEVPGDPASLVMVGNAGPDMWRAFAADMRQEPDALDRWTERVVGEVAAALGATALFPFGEPPPHPFQRWGASAEALHHSPLGVLIHPDYGLWHAYRAALAFTERIDLPAADGRPSPCESCADKPCLSTCPVAAFNGESYDVEACVWLLQEPRGADCMAGGCLARRACPVGTEYHYEPDQAAFHMTAFRKAQVEKG
jgi:ferredoxin